MGLFDFLKGGSGAKSQGKEDKAKATPAAKFAEKAGDKRAQTYDRQEAISALVNLAGFDPATSKEAKSFSAYEPSAIRKDAVAALLRRFNFQIDPSITDQEEKDTAFQGILRAGDDALEPLSAYAARAESLAWPMRIWKELLPREAYVGELIRQLSEWDTEYEKFIDPKIQLLHALEEEVDPRIIDAVKPFLHDVADQARFQAVSTVLAQKNADCIDDLVTHFLTEESVRIRTRIIDGFIANNWSLPEDRVDELRRVLPYGVNVDGDLRFRRFD